MSTANGAGSLSAARSGLVAVSLLGLVFFAGGTYETVHSTPPTDALLEQTVNSLMYTMCRQTHGTRQ